MGREAAATGDDAGAGGAGGGADEKKYVALEILNGGHYYYVPAAFEAVTGRSLPVASLRAKRGQVDGKWQVRGAQRAARASCGCVVCRYMRGEAHSLPRKCRERSVQLSSL